MHTGSGASTLRNEHRAPRWRDNLNKTSIDGMVRRAAAAGQCQVAAIVIRSGVVVGELRLRLKVDPRLRIRVAGG